QPPSGRSKSRNIPRAVLSWREDYRLVNCSSPGVVSSSMMVSRSIWSAETRHDSGNGRSGLRGLVAAVPERLPAPAGAGVNRARTAGSVNGGAPQSNSQLRLAGTIASRTQTDLGFRLAGRLVSRSVNIGDRVTAGQVLAEIDP